MSVGANTLDIPPARLAAFEQVANELSGTLGISWPVTLDSVSVAPTDVEAGLDVAKRNGVSELVELSEVGWLTSFPADSVARTQIQVDEPNCRILSADIYVRAARPSFPWNAQKAPSAIAPDPSDPASPIAYSYRQVMLHELGHAGGLDHYDATLALMNENYADGGNPGGGVAGPLSVVRLNADEQMALSSLHPGGSSGQNFMLYGFQAVPHLMAPDREAYGKSREIWTDWAYGHPVPMWPQENWEATSGQAMDLYL